MSNRNRILFPDLPNYCPQEEAISLRFLERPNKADKQTLPSEDTGAFCIF